MAEGTRTLDGPAAGWRLLSSKAAALEEQAIRERHRRNLENAARAQALRKRGIRPAREAKAELSHHWHAEMKRKYVSLLEASLANTQQSLQFANLSSPSVMQ